MSETGGTQQAVPRGGATLKSIVSRIWRAVKANRRLVVFIIFLGFVEALFTKAPILFLQPLLEILDVIESAEKARELGFTQEIVWQPKEEANYSDTLIGWAPGICESVGLTFDDISDPNHLRAVQVLVLVALGVLVCVFPGALAIYGVLVLSRTFATRIVVELRNEVAGHLLRLPMRFFGLRRMGELMSNITNDTAVLARSFSMAVDNVVTDPLMILVNVGILVFLFPQATWILLLMIPIMALPMYRIGRKVRKKSSRSLQAMGDATESMNQMLSGIRTVKSFQLEEPRLEEFERNNANYLRQMRRMFQSKARGQAFTFFGYQSLFVVVLILMGWVVVTDESVSFATMSVAIIPLATTYTHVKRLTRSYNVLLESVGALDGIEGLLRERPDTGSLGGGTKVERVEGNVTVEGLKFAYGDDEVLRGVDLSAQPGEKIAFVGVSGAGKSTLLDLLARFYDPVDGRILIDGHDLRDLDLTSYRRSLAIVSQQPFLFNTSIRQNILYGRPDATEEQLIAAATAAQVDEFVQALPDGYDTLVGERGANLSGGQMQRITIARALLRNPAILLLDEAMSALDSDSERAVQLALDNLMQGRTTFAIAHRLATIRNADQILVMDAGRVVERGTHDELVASEGIYARMWGRQS